MPARRRRASTVLDDLVNLQLTQYYLKYLFDCNKSGSGSGRNYKKRSAYPKKAAKKLKAVKKAKRTKRAKKTTTARRHY